jgi:hypothetical protein
MFVFQELFNILKIVPISIVFQISTKYRADLNATTMLGQSKTIIQVS